MVRWLIKLKKQCYYINIDGGWGLFKYPQHFNFFIVSNTCIRMKNKTFLEIEDFFGLRPYVLNMLIMHL